MIRLCSADEAIKILNQPQIAERVGLLTDKLSVQPWISYQGNYKMLFVFWLVSDGVYEMHIACPKKSIIKSRELAIEALNFALSNGANVVITNCPEGKIANMARKIGMTETKIETDKIWFEVKYGYWCGNSR